jgi:CubicO group peptidase (beta-lactamase class C family)
MIFTKVTGMKAFDFGMKLLFEQLGISNLRWGDVHDYTMGGYGLSMTSRDIAKIGYLYLNNGSWDKKQILATEWVAVSTRMQMEIQEKTLSRLGKGWLGHSINYGYLWYVSKTDGHDSFFLKESGRQFIYVMPDLDIVTAITSVGMGSSSQYFRIIDDFVVPSVVDK